MLQQLHLPTQLIMAYDTQGKMVRDIKNKLNHLNAETVLEIATEQKDPLWDNLMSLPQDIALKLVVGRLAIERAKVESLQYERNHKPQKG